MTIIRYLVFNIVSFRFGLVVCTANENQNHYLRFLLKSLFLIYRIIMEEKENKLINAIEAIDYFENKRYEIVLGNSNKGQFSIEKTIVHK